MGDLLAVLSSVTIALGEYGRCWRSSQPMGQLIHRTTCDLSATPEASCGLGWDRVVHCENRLQRNAEDLSLLHRRLGIS